jgi:hypothetical protein
MDVWMGVEVFEWMFGWVLKCFGWMFGWVLKCLDGCLGDGLGVGVFWMDV